ncbi:MAG: helix-turn-helix transcriptional regulator [Synergistaceae bacterium]|nr:helix-turn-helix transcriptional regulator [Synergistaceae bacterium]
MDGKNIAVIRKKRKITQEELAQALSINTATLSRWENGHFEPKASMIRKLCEMLCCTESELLSETHSNRAELVISWNWQDMKEGEMNMDMDKFKLVLGEHGEIGIHGMGMLTSREAIDEFIAHVREQLEIAFEAQLKRGAISEA